MRRRRTWLTLVFWIFISFLTLFPIYWLFVISVKPAVDLFTTPEVILRTAYWQNYIDVLNDSTLRRYMANSLIISTANAVLVTTLGFLACYALSRFDFGGKESIFFWTITNRMAPPAVFLLPLFLLMTQVYRIGDFSLLDTRIGMILVYCTFNLPFAIWTLRPTVDGIPKELDEAAFVDGASAWQVIAEVVFPLCRPGLAVTLILTWVFAWNEYLLAATLTNFRARTLTTGLSEYITTTGTEWGIMAAISVFTLIPALIIFSLVQRHIVAGLTFGAVKRVIQVADLQEIDSPIDIIEDEPPVIEEPTGFLPIQTNWFDRCFIGVVIWVAISLFWFRFLEPAGLSIWIGNAISLALAVYIVRKG